MTTEEYDKVMGAVDGDPIGTLLGEGCQARLERRLEKQAREAENKSSKETQTPAKASEQPPEIGETERKWAAGQLELVKVLLAPVKLEEFVEDEKLQKSVQTMLGVLRRGESLVPPPDAGELISRDAPLFRGTTLDSKTNQPYVGSLGSTKGGTPTSPGAGGSGAGADRQGHARRGQPEARRHRAAREVPRRAALLGIELPASLTAGEEFDKQLRGAKALQEAFEFQLFD
jgi:hypothetical protein